MDKPMDNLVHIGDEIEKLTETFKKQYVEAYGELPEESDEKDI